MAEQYSIVYMYHIFFIHSSVYGHLGCFLVLAIVKSVEINIVIPASFQTMFVSKYMPRSGIARSYGTLMSFLRYLILFFTVSVPIYIPVNSVGEFYIYIFYNNATCIQVYPPPVCESER